MSFDQTTCLQVLVKSNVDDVQRLWNLDGVKPATTVSKEEVRLLAIEYGIRETARRTGLNANTILSWSKRYSWFAHPASVTKQNGNAISAINSPSSVVMDELAEHERETRLSLARYARRASRDAEGASLRDAPYVKAVAEVTSKVHRWDSEKATNQFTLNVLNINALSEDE